MTMILVLSLALLTIMITSPSLVYAQDPFTFGNTNDPFSFSGGGSTQSNTNATLQIRSNTDWSGTYGDSIGSTTVDGYGDRDISLSCSGTYSADFQKNGEGTDFLTLTIVQNKSNPASIPNNPTIPIVGNSSNYTASGNSNAVSKKFPEYTPQIINSELLQHSLELCLYQANVKRLAIKKE